MIFHLREAWASTLYGEKLQNKYLKYTWWLAGIVQKVFTDCLTLNVFKKKIFLWEAEIYPKSPIKTFGSTF